MMSDAWQKRINLRYTITYNIIGANHKAESFKYPWLRALAMFDVTSFPAIVSGIGRHFKLSVDTLIKSYNVRIKEHYDNELYLCIDILRVEVIF